MNRTGYQNRLAEALSKNAIPFLHDVKCLLLASLVRNQALTVEIILDIHHLPPWRTEILQHPWGRPGKTGHSLEHPDAAAVHVLHVFLRKSLMDISMPSIDGTAAEL